MCNNSFNRFGQRGVILSLFIAFLLSFSHVVSAAGTEDPYLEGFEKYAQENPALASSVDAYTVELKKVMKIEPSLDESTKIPVK